MRHDTLSYNSEVIQALFANAHSVAKEVIQAEA